MQEINTDNDTHVFKIGIKDNGIVFVDGFELVSRCTRIESVADGKEPSAKDIFRTMNYFLWVAKCWLGSKTWETCEAPGEICRPLRVVSSSTRTFFWRGGTRTNG